MAEPARKLPELTETPPLDPVAVRHAYRQQRARRRARLQSKQDTRLAALRFYLVVLALLALTVFFGLTILRDIERLFGL